MRSVEDPAFEFIISLCLTEESPDDRTADKLFSYLYLFLVDTAVYLNRSQGRKHPENPFHDARRMLALTESWALALCEACNVPFELWAD